MILNIVVDAVVWKVLVIVYIPQEAQHGMGWAEGEINLVLYADDGRIVGWEYDRAQYELTVMLARFRRMGQEG